MSASEAKVQELVGKVVGDAGAAMTAALVHVGDQLGLWKGLAHGPQTPAELAKRTGTAERYVREWLPAMAAAGYATWDAKAQRFSLTPEQALAFAEEGSPAAMAGLFELITAMFRAQPKIQAAFKSGKGVGWHEHDACLFRGTERFFRPGYAANLISSWLPALEGVLAKLERGVSVADVGCGHGASTILMAQAFPRSRFTGFDYHAPSVEAARSAAQAAGLGPERVKFEVSPAKAFPGAGYALVTFFDCLHDMGDPVGAAAHVRQALAPDGTWMIVEPFAGDAIEQNLNPVGRVFYSASTMICTPASLSQEVGLALGAQAGEKRLREVVQQGGFSRFRRATETPFNLILEARP